MCGIAGIFHFTDPARPVDRAVLLAMTRTLAHRGPDGEGLWLHGPIGLGHRRLAIIDLSPAASQPMTDESGQYAITFNGEIYNFRELRAVLEARGHRFRSHSDTEVVLAGYREWGSEVVTRISGIYAFAIWDGVQRQLLLARDPLGVKPLFYSLQDGSLRFGSEVKAILRDPTVSRDFNGEALDAFLTFGYTPAPATGFSAVSQLPPGHLATVSGTGWHNRRFFEQPYPSQACDLPFDAAVQEFTALLDRTTRAQMVSDVGVGAFLSGGLDSAAIVRAMARAGTGPVRAFSVGLDWQGFDELAGARSAAASIGVEMAEKMVRLDDAGILPALSRHLEEPTADSSCLPTYLLCREAAAHFKVAMSGDGADEILAGYDTYSAAIAARYYRMLPGWLRRQVLVPLARRIPASDAKYSLREVATRFAYAAELGPDRDHSAWRVIFDDGLKQRLYQPRFLAAAATCDPLGQYVRPMQEVPASRERLARLLHADTAFYLPNDMLVKVDRMSMANGLEVRVPFLDEAMVRFCAALPGRYKLRHGSRRKHILRESLRGTLPPQRLQAPKSGFNIPVEQWMRGLLRELLLDSLQAARDELGAFLRVDEVVRLAEDHRARRVQAGHALFVILMFALWLDNARRCWKPDGQHEASHP